MWKLLQRKSTVSALPLPAAHNGGLSAIARLWRSEKAPTRRPVVLAMASKGFDDPEITQRIPAQRPAPQSTNSQETAPRKRVPAPRQTDEYASRLMMLKAQHEELSAHRTQIDQVGQRQRDRVADLEARLRFLRQTLDPQLANTPIATPIAYSTIATRSSKTPTAAFAVPYAGDETGEETVKIPAVARPSLTPAATPRQSLTPAATPRQSVTPSATPVVGDAVREADYRRAVAEAQHLQETAQELERQIHTLSQLVRVDSLTGLSNRRSFDEHLPRAVARAKRVHDSVCLLMIDIDHFKRLNDTHGHPAGDAVLRSVASSIAGCTRPSDHVARYGGEEFAVVLSDIDSAQAFAVAERIRRQVAHSDHCPHKVTVSIGLAEYRANAASLNIGSHEELLAAADKALYAAKHGGRNCVAVAPGCSVELTLPSR